MVAILLEGWWFRFRLAPGRIAQRENHNRDFMHRTFAAAHNNPDDDEETRKGEPNEKVISVILNQVIQNLGDTRNNFHRVFHVNLSEVILTLSANYS